MSLTSDISDSIATVIDAAGESVTIYPFVGDSVTVNGLVTGGTFERVGVSGGFYDEITFMCSVLKTDLGTFVPQPGMLVDARDTELRVDNDGVTFFRAHYRLRLVSRTAIK